MKKIAALLLAGIMAAVACTGCGTQSGTSDTSSQSTDDTKTTSGETFTS